MCLSTICLERALVHQADHLVHDFAALEEHHRRDAANHVAHRDRGIVVHVELAHADLADIVPGEGMNRRLHRATRATPFRPEVHHHGRGRLQHVCVEVAVCKRLDVLG